MALSYIPFGATLMIHWIHNGRGSMTFNRVNDISTDKDVIEKTIRKDLSWQFDVPLHSIIVTVEEKY